MVLRVLLPPEDGPGPAVSVLVVGGLVKINAYGYTTFRGIAPGSDPMRPAYYVRRSESLIVLDSDDPDTPGAG